MAADVAPLVPFPAYDPIDHPSTWLSGVDEESPFSLANVPLGIISTNTNPQPRVGTAVGIWVLDLQELARHADLGALVPGLRDHLHVLAEPTLNALAALGRPVHSQLRGFVQHVFSEATSLPWLLRDNESLKEKVLIPRPLVKMHLPMQVGDYTDFYAGRHHAQNVGSMFRDPEHALQPNYTNLPVGYHGRASSIVISETPIRRPQGQYLAAQPSDGDEAQSQVVVTGPSTQIDFELELGCFLVGGNEMGVSIGVDEAEDHIFGYVLLNDWSARDIQKWEYQPLGPFNSKNFATTISPWVVLADALEPFRTEALANQTLLQAYLKEGQPRNVFDLQLEVELTTSDGFTSRISRVSSRNLLWSFPQMIAHHTLGGCPARTGDLLGSGTISGPSPGERGCLLELSEGGKTSVRIAEGVGRTFLEDGDTVTFRGLGARADRFCVGFGDCIGTIAGMA